MFRQGRRHADDDDIALCKFGKVTCRAKPFRRHLGFESLVRYRFDIGAPRIERDFLARIDIETGNGKTAARQSDRKRQSDVAKPYDTGVGPAVLRFYRRGRKKGTKPICSFLYKRRCRLSGRF